ncbi:MAG: DNA-binding NarL/FixJ family response regulator [Cellvibrionaceae bacterium]|jgi:DNA-binding NarL/FixJ family response regulator
MSTVKILIVDDHDLMRMGLSRILDDVDGFSVVGEASSGEEALSMCRALSPDLILMDVKMPGIGGVEATRRLLAVNENAKVMAVTSCEDDLYPTRLLQAGASAYISKRTQPDEVIKAIKMVMSGRSYVSHDIAQQLALKNTGKPTDAESPFEQLSERELQIAMMIVRGEKPVAIAEKLNISSKTINSYRYRVFEKFDINSDVELVHLAIRHKVFDVDTLE